MCVYIYVYTRISVSCRFQGPALNPYLAEIMSDLIYVYIYICIQVNMYIYTYKYVYIYIHIFIYICMYVCIHVSLSVSVHAYLYQPTCYSQGPTQHQAAPPCVCVLYIHRYIYIHTCISLSLNTQIPLSTNMPFSRPCAKSGSHSVTLIAFPRFAPTRTNNRSGCTFNTCSTPCPCKSLVYNMCVRMCVCI